MSESLALTLSPEALEAIAERAAEIVLEGLERERSPWMDRKEAALYLGLPVSRLEKDRCIPCHRDGGRVLYHRAELDSYFRGLTSGRDRLLSGVHSKCPGSEGTLRGRQQEVSPDASSA